MPEGVNPESQGETASSWDLRPDYILEAADILHLQLVSGSIHLAPVSTTKMLFEEKKQANRL